MVQWLRLHVVNPESMGLISARGTKIPHVVQHLPSKKKKKMKRQHSQNHFTKPALLTM